MEPELSDAWHSKGMSLHNLERYEEAIACYNEAIKIDPKEADTWIEKGNSLANLEKYDESIACYDKVVACHDEANWLDPDHDVES